MHMNMNLNNNPKTNPIFNISFSVQMPHNDNFIFINKNISAETYLKSFVSAGISLRILGQLY